MAILYWKNISIPGRLRVLAGRNVYIDMYGHTHPHTEFREKNRPGLWLRKSGQGGREGWTGRDKRSKNEQP